MQGRELYEGFALQAVDEKGRVAIPADLRAALERNSDAGPDARVVVVSNHPFDTCLMAHDLNWSKEKLRRIDKPEQSPLQKDDANKAIFQQKRSAFGVAERAQFDTSGRFVLPPFFRSKAKIGKWAFFNGSGETFDIWAPEALLATAGSDMEELREICEFLCQQKGVTL